MKEPGKTAAKQRETVYFRTSQWKDGKPINNGASEYWENMTVQNFNI